MFMVPFISELNWNFEDVSKSQISSLIQQPQEAKHDQLLIIMFPTGFHTTYQRYIVLRPYNLILVCHDDVINQLKIILIRQVSGLLSLHCFVLLPLPSGALHPTHTLGYTVPAIIYSLT
ncbi:hypothetical protein AAHE18_06G160900 [Arachis hypogaea]